MKFLSLAFLIAISSISHAAINFENDKNSGQINFLAVGRPAMIKIKGNASAPLTKAILNKDILSVESQLSLESLNTGIDLRDEHMKEKYLQIKEFPMAVLKINSINLPSGFELKPISLKELPFVGTLMLHGKEQIINGVFSLSDNFQLSASFTIKLSDFGIEVPSYLGINVADNVLIDTQFKLIKSQ